MTRFSASDAALEGYGLIRRQWRVTLGWAAFNLLALVMILVLTVMLEFVASAMGGGDAGPAKGPAAIGVIGGLVLQAILASGVIRLEMNPREPAFLYLRLGGNELRLVSVWLIMLLAAGVIFSLAQAAAAALGQAALAAHLCAIAVTVYLGLRFALTAQASAREGRLAFVSSWRLTRGRVLTLLGMTALTLCLTALLLVSVTVALALIAVAAGGMETLGSVFSEGAEAFKRHPGMVVLYAAVEIILTPVLWIVATAPFVAAYRAFSAQSTPKTRCAI